MKFGFVTCVELGLSCLEAIYSIGGKIDLLITLEDEIFKKKSGRIFLDSFSNENNVKLLKIKHINDDIVLHNIKKYNLDWLFIIGWSQIANIEIVNAPLMGCIGAHPTLLPKGRGRASIPWAILKKLNYTGLTFFKIDNDVDTGNILLQKKIKLSKKETATTLYKRMNQEHIRLIKKLWIQISKNCVNEIVQNNRLSSYWQGRKPKDGEMNLSMKLEDVDLLVRATTRPYPGAYIYYNHKKIIIWNGRSINKIKSSNKKILKFSDGYYEILNYEIENV